jgi:hypothetical protein
VSGREYQLQRSPSGYVNDLHATIPGFQSALWTPTPTFAGDNTGLTGTQYAQYDRLGKRVYLDVIVTLSAKGSATGAFEIYSLPYGAVELPALNVFLTSTSTAFVSVEAKLISGTLGFLAIGLFGRTSAAITPRAMVDTDFNDNTIIEVSGHYRIVETG